MIVRWSVVTTLLKYYVLLELFVIQGRASSVDTQDELCLLSLCAVATTMLCHGRLGSKQLVRCHVVILLSL